MQFKAVGNHVVVKQLLTEKQQKAKDAGLDVSHHPGEDNSVRAVVVSATAASPVSDGEVVIIQSWAGTRYKDGEDVYNAVGFDDIGCVVTE